MRLCMRFSRPQDLATWASVLCATSGVHYTNGLGRKTEEDTIPRLSLLHLWKVSDALNTPFYMITEFPKTSNACSILPFLLQCSFRTCTDKAKKIVFLYGINQSISLLVWRLVIKVSLSSTGKVSLGANSVFSTSISMSKERCNASIGIEISSAWETNWKNDWAWHCNPHPQWLSSVHVLRLKQERFAGPSISLQSRFLV